MGAFHSMKPRNIELITLLFTVIAIGVLIWGLVDIPFDDIVNSGKIFYIIGCILVVLVFIILLCLMCLRIGNKINESLNEAGKGLCLALLIVDVLAFIAIVVSEVIILVDMGNKDDDYFYENNIRRFRGKGEFSRRDWAAAGISTTVAAVAMALNVLCLDSLYKTIKSKTNLSYEDYLESQKPNGMTGDKKVEEVSKTVAIFNSPPNNQTNQNFLSFIGYDKDGHPIYSGNTQYYIQNQKGAK